MRDHEKHCDDELVSMLNDNNLLLDAKLTSLCIKEVDNEICVLLSFIPLSEKNKNEINIIFKQVFKFDFFYENDMIFYNIERVKLFKTKDQKYYLSIDPYDESNEAHEDDRGVFISSRIEGSLQC